MKKVVVFETSPVDRDVLAVKAEVEKSVVVLDKYQVTLTTAEKKAAVKARPGGDRIVLLVAELAEKYGAKVKNHTPDGMRAQVALGTSLQTWADFVVALSLRAGSSVFDAKSKAWLGGMRLYKVLAAMAVEDPDLANELKPVVDFMANGPRDEETQGAAATNGVNGTNGAAATHV